MDHDTTEIIVDHGYGSNYFQTVFINTKEWNYINCRNNYTDRSFLTEYKIGDLYTYRGKDNHILQIQYYSNVRNSFYTTNLILSVLTKDGNGLFDGNYIYFDTNAQVNMTQMITAPLTSNQVKIEIANGNYEIYMQNGITYYKIGENLYLPRYGDSYVYAGTTNQTGMLDGYVRYYYRLKFRII